MVQILDVLKLAQCRCAVTIRLSSMCLIHHAVKRMLDKR
jgi:hypothetical protein